MPVDIARLIEPARTAIVSMECQENLLGADSVIPALAEAAAGMDLIGTLSRFYAGARAAGVRIFYCTDERRADGFGTTDNMPITSWLRRPDGTPHVGGHGPVVAPIAPQPEDVVFRREQGVTGFFATGLDQYLRNSGVRTLVVTGVSLNLAVLGTTIEAASRGYTTIVPTDATAGVPADYVDAVLRNTIRHIAYTTTTAVLLDRWATGAAPL